MRKKPVSCPYCQNIFTTSKKEDIQCSDCKERFDVGESVLDLKKSQKLAVKVGYEKQIKKIEDLLEKLSSKNEETGITIKEIRKITKEPIRK